MADKATLEIKIQDAGGTAPDYSGPIRGPYGQMAAGQEYGPYPSVVPYAQPIDRPVDLPGINELTNAVNALATSQQDFDLPGLDKLTDAANRLGNDLPAKIQTAIDSLIASADFNNQALQNDPSLQSAYMRRAGELRGEIARHTEKADERKYQETFGRPSDKEMERRKKQQDEEEQDAHLDWMQLLKQQNEQTQSLIRNTTGLTRQFGGLAGSIAALDINSFSRQLTFATSQIPYVGEYLGLFTMALTGAIDGINDTADRFSRFSPDLAVTDANIRVERILRDIENAQRLGPQLAGFRQRQEEVRQRAEDLLLDILPQLIPLAERGLDYAETMVAMMESVNDRVGAATEFLDRFNVNLFGTNYSGSQFAGLALGGPLVGMLELLTRIRENTEQATPQTSNQADFLVDLFRDVNMPNNPAAMDNPANGPANIPGAQGQLPPRLPNPIP